MIPFFHENHFLESSWNKTRNPHKRGVLMEMTLLKDMGVPPWVIDRWSMDLGPTLLPIQTRAVCKHGLLEGKSLVVFAPTSSGKTFVGELATIHAVEQRRKVFYLSPLKAIAHEKYEEFVLRYQDMGITVALSTRDYSKDDERIRDQQFDIAILVYEKLQSLLISKTSLLEGVGLVVVDELQMLGDETRGAGLELLLTKVLLTNPSPQIVGLSAVLPEAASIAKWLKAQVLETDIRPVELRKGALLAQTFHYREHNAKQEGTEKLLPLPVPRQRSGMVEAAVMLGANAEQTIIFLADKKGTLDVTEELYQQAKFPPAHQALEELYSFERCSERDILCRLLERGVAFHNADLGWEYRAVVEQAFRTGEIRVLVSTSTLAMGMNLPCTNVLIEPWKWNSNGRNGWNKVPLTRREFENMAGRAGRQAAKRNFGRAIILAESEWDVHTLRKKFLDADFEPFAPALSRMGLPEQVLNLVAGEWAKTPEEAAEILTTTLSSKNTRLEDYAIQEHEANVKNALNLCLKANLIERDRLGHLVATDTGKIIATKGLRVETARMILEFIDGLDTHIPHALEFLHLAGITPDGQESYCNLSTEENRDYRYLIAFRQAIRDHRLSHRPDMSYYLERRGITYDETKVLKKALMLLQWTEEYPLEDIENQFDTWEGALRRISQDYTWIINAAAQIMEVQEWEAPWLEVVHGLCARLSNGVREVGTDLGLLRVRGLGRISTRRLIDAGLGSIQALSTTRTEEIFKILKNRPLTERLVEAVRLHTVTQQKATPSNAKSDAPQEPLLLFDAGKQEISYSGASIPLPPKAFQLFSLLAQKAGQFCSTGHILKVIWGQDTLEADPRLVHDQVRILKREIETGMRKSSLNPGKLLDLIRSKHSTGYMLKFPSEQIQFV
jgi:helicase